MQLPPTSGLVKPYWLLGRDHVDFGRFPDYSDGGPATVAIDGWNCSYESLCAALSSPAAVAEDDGKVTLRIFRYDTTRREFTYHPLHESRYDTRRDAKRAAFEAGVIAYMVYVQDAERYGIEA